MPAEIERRPDPERLLKQVMAQERATGRERLKVFLGYASGVGKSMRMMSEARRRAERGQDVVVAAVQAERSADIDCALTQLEVIPPKLVDGVLVLDMEAILARHPRVCIVDAAAYDNPPGSRHPKRWMDIDELVNSGITVITSLNLQHIAEEQDKVARITGKTTRETVPKAFLSKADEIVVVDVPSEALMERTGETDGDPDRPRRLSALREMTLLLTAEIVDEQLELHLREQGIDQSWGTHERILVCFTARGDATRMIASGVRNRDRFHGDLLALYVEPDRLTAEDEKIVESSLAKARDCGAEVHILVDQPDPVQAILEFARTHRVTQIFVGHGRRWNWRHWLAGSPLDRLIRGAEGIDIRVFPH